MLVIVRASLLGLAVLGWLGVSAKEAQVPENEDDYVKAAMDAAAEGDWETAKDYAQLSIQHFQSPIGHSILSQIYLMGGEHKHALDEMMKGATLAKGTQHEAAFDSHVLFHKAIVTQDTGNYPLALSLYKESVDTLGENADPKTLEKGAMATAALGDIPTCVSYLKRLWAAFPLYQFHNNVPFVRIADAFDEMVENARLKNTLPPLMKELSNITKVTDTIFLDISIAGGKAERVEIGLFGIACPRAANNMKRMAACDDETDAALCYRGSTFHRIIRDFIIQGGDVINRDGTGRTNIYRRPFGDEVFSLALMHDGPGVVQMANSGADSNGGQFVIMADTAAHLNGNHVVVGRVVSGMETVLRANQVDVDVEDYKPLKDVVIKDCGVVSSTK